MRNVYKLGILSLVSLLLFLSNTANAQVSLTATAGTPTGSFTTISDAFAAINAGTHQGDIVISIDGNVTEPLAPVALTADGIGSALFTSVLIKPSVVATVSGAPSVARGVINFTGSDNVIIDGSVTVGGTTRDLTFVNTNAITFANTTVIRLIGQTTAGTGLGINNFTIKNTNIVGNTPGNNGTSGSTVTTSYGIYAGSNSTTALSATAAGANYDNLTIENNAITKAYYGINVYGGIAPNQNDNLIIRGNTLGSSVVADYIGLRGIYVYQNLNGLIESNTVSNIRATSSITVAGIEIGGTASNTVTVSRNRIEGIYSESTGGWGAYGINMIGGNNHIVANNVITDVRTNNFSATSNTFNAFGIRITAGTGLGVYYNSVNLYGNYPASAAAAASAAFLVTSTAVTGLNVFNNVFNNVMTSATTGAKEFHAMWFPTAYNFANATLNNNFYGIPNDADHFVGKVGLTAGAGNYSTLTSWQAIAQVGNANNDLLSAPINNTPAPFTSNTDLTVPAGTITHLESGAVAILALGSPNVDFNGTIRPLAPGTAPDMGAYEFAGLPITCPQPIALTADASNVDAILGWTSQGAETQWQIEYGLLGFTPGTGTLALAPSNPFTITGLTPNSFYSFYVRAICGPGDSSFWSGPFTFNTYNQAAFMDWSTACPAAGFIDISTTGTNLNLTDDGEAAVNPLPFPILFQGQLMTNMTVGNNGGIQLGSTTAQIGYGGNFNTMASGTMFPWGDDLDDETGDVFVGTVGTSPNSVLVIQWENSNNFSNGAGTVTFQIQIEEATGDIYYVYEDVIFGDLPADDFGGNADIGLSGANQDITISTNNQTYLQNNSCVRFYYTDCPAPANFQTSYIFADEAAVQWSAGLAAETNWTVIYGPAGFDPATGGITINTTATNATLPNLDQLTQYDVYIYADCDPTLQSLGLFGTFLTLPYCSYPTAMINTTAVDSIFSSWSWTAGSPDYPVLGFNIQYGMNGFDLYSGTTVNLDGDLNDSIIDNTLLPGGVYQLYLQAVCTDVVNGGTDTSGYVGPFNVTMPLTNDSICYPVMLEANGFTYTFNNAGATVELGENVIAPPTTGANTETGWINSTLNNTTWFTFVAPASGNVRINNTNINYAGQAAVYEVGDCSDLTTFELMAANDNSMISTSNAPNFSVCGLTPGAVYYLLHDGNATTAGNYSIQINPINLNAGVITDIIDVCYGDTVNLFDGITGYDANGVWTAELPSAGTGLTDSIFATAGLAYQIFNFEYRLTDGCAFDTTFAKVQIYRPSSAGNDGTISVCRNEPFDLLAGLSGNIDAGGTWYNPSNQPLSESMIVSSNIPGQFNYYYITGNGVCPDDTSLVLVNVSSSCNYLSAEEMFMQSLNIYPNPNNGVFTVASSEKLNGLSIEITDMNGKMIKSFNNAELDNFNSIDINLSEHDNGVYFLRLHYGSHIENVRVIKN
jgi:hypothetical protein